MKKFLIILQALAFYLLSSPIESNFKIQTQSEISSIQITSNNLYVSTINGSVEIYTLNKTPTLSKIIKLPKYQDLFENSYAPKIFNTSSNQDNDILIVSANNNGTRNLNLFQNNQIILLLENLNIAKALWLNSHQILIGLLSHEILLFDITSKKIIYQTQISQSSFSDMILNASKTILFTTGESGIIYAINPSNGAILNTFDTINKDKVFQIVTANNTLVSGGQDRQVGIYNFTENALLSQSKNIKAKFLVYAVGISHDGRYIAYLKNENGEIGIIDTKTGQEKLILKNINAIANTILFYKDFVIVACDNNIIYFFNIKEKL